MHGIYAVCTVWVEPPLVSYAVRYDIAPPKEKEIQTTTAVIGPLVGHVFPPSHSRLISTWDQIEYQVSF